MEHTAGSALSSRVIRADSQARPVDLAAELAKSRATHVAVFQAEVCRGVVPVSEALRIAPGQTFGELLPAIPPPEIACDLSLAATARLLAESEFDALPVRDESGAYLGTVTRLSLLAELARQNDVLAGSERQIEQRLQQVIDSAPVLLFATDRSGVYTLSEGMAVRDFGARPGDAVGVSAFERYRDIPVITESIRRALAGEEFTAVAEIRGRTFECRCAPTVGSDGEVSGMIGVATDITDRVQAERQTRRLLDELAQMARVTTMGEMASGLAHELNQPLAAIVAYVDACQELVESGRMSTQQLTEVLRSVAGQAERAGQIIHRLRKMIRRRQPVRASMSVNDAVREVAVLLDAEAHQAGVTIELVLREDLSEIAADFLQVQQVIQNLMRNGLEAMTDVPPDQRRLTITTEGSAAGGIEIVVSDGGHGLSGAAAEQVFEPFFTTKTGGLGLGLSISRTIVEAHGGQIWLTPNSPHGITTRLRLPVGGGKVDPDADADSVHRG
jgi:PAS domain S-box-containing protein